MGPPSRTEEGKEAWQPVRARRKGKTPVVERMDLWSAELHEPWRDPPAFWVSGPKSSIPRVHLGYVVLIFYSP